MEIHCLSIVAYQGRKDEWDESIPSSAASGEIAMQINKISRLPLVARNDNDIHEQF